MKPDTAEKGYPYQTAVGGSGVLEDAQSLWEELHGLAHDRFRLAGLETRRAGESLVVMVAAAVMLAILLGGTWLGLLAAAVLWLITLGFGASSALMLAVACNGLAAYGLWGLIRRQSRHLQFPSTLRSLQPKRRERD